VSAGGEPRGVALGAVVPPALVVLAALAAWQAAPALGWVRPTSVPPPTTVLPAVGGVLTDPRFGPDLLDSARRWAIGVAVAAVGGTALGVLMGRSARVERVLDPVLVMLYPVPKVALVLLLVLWFGTGDLTRVLVIVLGTSVPIIIAAFHGANEVDRRLLWSARALGTRPAAVLHRVVLPAALPSVLSGGRIALSISIFTLLASELLIRDAGVGAYLFNRLDSGQFVDVWATALLLAALGFLLDRIYVAAVRGALRWWDGEV